LDTLVAECSRGRQIEVALWLWNLSHLDAQLQKILDALDPSQRSRYESLYTDRNEALLYLSKKLPDILKAYRGSLDESIKSKRRISLLARAREAATSQLARMARELSFRAEIPISLDQDIETTFRDQFGWVQSPDSLFLEKAAHDLEEWLAGASNSGPSFLTSEEADLLKLLYQYPSNLKAVAKLAKAPVGKIKKKLKPLERKVALYLGVSPEP
jgi:hypothetical protein